MCRRVPELHASARTQAAGVRFPSLSHWEKGQLPRETVPPLLHLCVRVISQCDAQIGRDKSL